MTSKPGSVELCEKLRKEAEASSVTVFSEGKQQYNMIVPMFAQRVDEMVILCLYSLTPLSVFKFDINRVYFHQQKQMATSIDPKEDHCP